MSRESRSPPAPRWLRPCFSSLKAEIILFSCYFISSIWFFFLNIYHTMFFSGQLSSFYFFFFFLICRSRNHFILLLYFYLYIYSPLEFKAEIIFFFSCFTISFHLFFFNNVCNILTLGGCFSPFFILLFHFIALFFFLNISNIMFFSGRFSSPFFILLLLFLLLCRSSFRRNIKDEIILFNFFSISSVRLITVLTSYSSVVDDFLFLVPPPWP